ncbi:MAG: hypothetical protein ABIP48_06120 [Planctomycetota bacterium]
MASHRRHLSLNLKKGIYHDGRYLHKMGRAVQPSLAIARLFYRMPHRQTADYWYKQAYPL